MKYDTGFIAGCFDLIHPGYIAALKEAKSICNYLIVGLHNDPSLERPEKARPILPLEDRTETLKAIRYVDHIMTYDAEEDLLAILNLLSIFKGVARREFSTNVRFLGDDYKDRTDYTGYGLDIDIHFLSRSHGWSATLLKEHIRSTG